MKRSTRTIVITAILIILLFFLYRSAPIGNGLTSNTADKQVGTIVLDRNEKEVGPFLLDRYILGVPEELQHDAIFFSSPGGEIAITLLDPMNLAVAWDRNWDTIVNWEPESCQLTLAGWEGIYQSDIAGDEVTPIINYSSLNSYPVINRGLFFPSPDMSQVIVWSPQGEYHQTDMYSGWYDVEDLYLFSIYPPQPGTALSINHGATTAGHPRLAFNGRVRWAPNNQFIAYIDYSANSMTYQLFLYDLQTGSRTQITNLTEPRPVLYNANIYGIRFSPDSAYLLASYYPHYDVVHQDERTLIWDIAQSRMAATLDPSQYRILNWLDEHTLLLLDRETEEFLVFDIVENSFFDYQGYLSSAFFESYWGYFIPETDFYVFFYYNRAAQSEDLHAVDLSTGIVYLIPGVTQYIPYLSEYHVYLHDPEGNACFDNP
jgi:hypothetical protein